MAHREEISSPGVSPEYRHNEGASGETGHDGLHPNAADFIHKVVGGDISLDDIHQLAAERFAEHVIGMYRGLRTRVPKRYREVDAQSGEIVAAYVKGTPVEALAQAFGLDASLLLSRIHGLARYARDYDLKGSGKLFEHMLDRSRGWVPARPRTIPISPDEPAGELPGPLEPTTQTHDGPVVHESDTEPEDQEVPEPAAPAMRYSPRRLTTLNFMTFLPEESKNASQEDIDRLIGWIQAAAAVWVRRNRGVELDTDATEEELGTIFGIGGLALRQLIRSVLIKEVGIQAYYLGDRGMDRDDLMSHGLLGGLKAIDYYHPRQGGNFRSYARSFIKGAMRHALRDEMPVIHLPRRKHEDLHRIRQVQGSKQDATIEYIATELNMQQHEVKAVLDAGDRIIMSFNAMTFEPVIAAKSALADSPEQHARLHKALSILSPKEADAIRLRFGISDGPESEGATAPRAVDEVAVAMGLSRSRVDVLLRTAREKLKDSLKDTT